MEQNIKSDNAISNEEYFEIAKQFVFDEVYNTYDEEEIIEYPDEDIEVVSQDANGIKLIMIPFQLNEDAAYGLILLEPVKDWATDEMMLSCRRMEIVDCYDNLSIKIEEFKKYSKL